MTHPADTLSSAKTPCLGTSVYVVLKLCWIVRMARPTRRPPGCSVNSVRRLSQCLPEPDGFNINERCGSTHPEQLQQRVIEEAADMGIAFDGDGDRLVMVEEKGKLLDGDHLLYAITRSRQARQTMRGGVVGTVMSNLGLERALQELSVPFVRAKVGDRHIARPCTSANGPWAGNHLGIF